MFSLCKKEEVYQCNNCNKKFYNYGSYVNHLKYCSCYIIVNNKKSSSCIIL